MKLRLALLDLDGTLKQERDPYIYLHKELETWKASQAFFEQGLAGQIPYAEWLRLDASLWVGVTKERLERLFLANPFLPGARETVRELKRSGLVIALISTGLRLHADQVARQVGADHVVANEVFFQNGRISGETRAVIPEGGKGPVVRDLQTHLGIGPEASLAVGDGESDVAMFKRAAVAVAVNPASARVRQAAHIILEQPDLSDLIRRMKTAFPGALPPPTDDPSPKTFDETQTT